MRTTRRVGDRAVLLEANDLDEVLGLAAAIHAEDLDGVIDVVPAACTVLVTTEPDTDLTALTRRLSSLTPLDTSSQDNGEIEIPVQYDGPDLVDVAEHTGLSQAEVINAHTETRWRIGFGGFAPGFAYLAGGNSQLHVPRRAEPRTKVPTGAVGLAGEFSGIYPRSSPGGWQLIGSTEVVLWDLERDPPALLQPGGWVRFVDAGTAR